MLSLFGLNLSASWIRDSSFTLYALIRLGFTQEANGSCMPGIHVPRSMIYLYNSLHGFHIRPLKEQESGRKPANYVHDTW